MFTVARSQLKHGHRHTVTVKEEEGVEEEMFSTLSSFVGSPRLIFEFSGTFHQLEVLK